MGIIQFFFFGGWGDAELLVFKKNCTAFFVIAMHYLVSMFVSYGKRSFRSDIRDLNSNHKIYKMYKQPTNTHLFYDIRLFTISSPTCFGQQSGHLQGDIFDTRMQV